jgi:hypothetical protein
MIARLVQSLKRLLPRRSTASRLITDDAITTAQDVRQRLDDRTTARRREVAATRLEQTHIRRHIRQNFLEAEMRRNRRGTP